MVKWDMSRGSKGLWDGLEGPCRRGTWSANEVVTVKWVVVAASFPNHPFVDLANSLFWCEITIEAIVFSNASQDYHPLSLHQGHSLSCRWLSIPEFYHWESPSHLFASSAIALLTLVPFFTISPSCLHSHGCLPQLQPRFQKWMSPSGAWIPHLWVSVYFLLGEVVHMDSQTSLVTCSFPQDLLLVL